VEYNEEKGIIDPSIFLCGLIQEEHEIEFIT